jgi:hypothetical protein
MTDNLVFRTTDSEKWGTGKGSALSATEVDLNFWEVIQRIIALETDPLAPVTIADITGDNASITIIMSDETEYGPFPLPVAQFTFYSAWENNHEYNVNDFILVEGSGTYLVLIDHTAPDTPATFNPNALDGGNPIYRQIAGTPTPPNYDLATAVYGLIPASGKLGQFVAARAFRLAEDLPGSKFYLDYAPTAEFTAILYKNEDEIGTVTWAIGEFFGVASFTTTVDFAIDDIFYMFAQEELDDTAADFSATLIAQAI